MYKMSWILRMKRKRKFVLIEVCLNEKLYRVKRENHERCDTIGFWEDGTGKHETRFRLLIFNRFSLRRTFQSIVSHLIISCVMKTQVTLE